MGDHSSLSRLHKLVGIISFLFLWHARVRPFIGADYTRGTPCGAGTPIPSCAGHSISIPCSPNQGLPCEEAKALQNVLYALGSQLESHINITGSYCNDKSKPIKCNCSYTGNLCHITEINLNDKSLSGYIHEHVSDLGSLVTLDLSSNRLSGTIPDSLGTLSNLTTLDLSANQLIGSIPMSLGKLHSLTSLDLSSNQLTGRIPESLEKLRSLTTLYLYDNQFTGPIPKSLGKLQSLTELELGELRVMLLCRATVATEL